MPTSIRVTIHAATLLAALKLATLALQHVNGIGGWLLAGVALWLWWKSL